MKIFLLVFLSSIAQFSFSQNERDADSLKHVLKNLPEDSNRVRALLNLANLTLYASPDSAMRYTDEGMSIAKKLNWQKGIASAYRQKGYVYYVQSDYRKSMDACLEALRAGASMNNLIFNASVYNNIANIYADLKNYDKALNYYSRYLKIGQETKDKVNEMYGYVNIGNIYTEIDSLSLGVSYFNKALQLAYETGDKRVKAAILNNLGEIFLKKNEYATAASYFKKSLVLADSTQNKNVKATALNSMGIIYLHNKDYKQAVAYSSQVLKLATEVGDLSWQANALNNLSDTYEKENLPLKALQAFRQSVALKDSVVNDAKKRDIIRLEVQYSFDTKEANIKAANDKKQALALAEIQRQKVLKNASFTIGGIFILVSFAGIILYKRRKENIEKRKDAEFKAQVANTELKALRSQMNPHFIFNSLNSINDYIDKHDIDKAMLYTTKFAKLMRLTLENSEHQEIPIAEDLKALELYMQLEALRMNHKFTYEIKVDENIDQQNTLIPPLILQPFVENSIWHGIAKKESEGKIWIHIEKGGNMINCIVKDNGIGIAESASNKMSSPAKKSFGMKITKARIDIINRVRNSNGTVIMSSLENGTKVQVTFPEALAF